MRIGCWFGTGDGKLGMDVGASVLGIMMAIHLAIMLWLRKSDDGCPLLKELLGIGLISPLC
jgi:hypothetical protein